MRFTIPKAIIDSSVDNFKNTLIGRFMGIQLGIEIIKRWMVENWKTKGHAEFIALPREFLSFKFACE